MLTFVLRDFEDTLSFYSFRRYNNDNEYQAYSTGADEFADTLFPNDEYVRTLLNQFREYKIGDTIYKYIDNYNVITIANNDWNTLLDLRNSVTLAKLSDPDVDIMLLDDKYSDLDFQIYYTLAKDGDNLVYSFYTNGTIDANSSYYWNFGDGNSSSSSQPTHTYTSNGNYTVSLVISDPNGGYGKQSFKISFSNSYIPCSAYFTFDVVENGSGTWDVYFEDASSGQVNNGVLFQVNEWEWDFDDDNTSSERNPIHEYTEEGIYTVKLTINDNGFCTDDYSDDVEIECKSDVAGNSHPWDYASKDDGEEKMFFKGWIEWGLVYSSFGSKTKHLERNWNNVWKPRKADIISCGNNGTLYGDACFNESLSVNGLEHRDEKEDKKSVRYSHLTWPMNRFHIKDDEFFSLHTFENSSYDLGVLQDIYDGEWEVY